jgi:hypothetical protein
MPAMTAIQEHVEAHVNTFRRGKGHSVPKWEKDVLGYAQLLTKDEAFTFVAGRQLADEDIPRDCFTDGADALASGSWLADWVESRDIEYYTAQDWNQNPTEERYEEFE